MHGMIKNTATNLTRGLMCSLAGLVLLGGCDSATEPTPWRATTDPQPAFTAPKRSTDPVFVADSDTPGPAAKPPAVNVFGELDGSPRPAATSTGGANFQQQSYLDEGYDGDVCVDPTGHFMVFASTRDSLHANLYLQRVDGLSVTQLTSDASDHAFPVFSPDGKKIAFCSTRAGNWNLYLMDADGRNVVQVTNGPAQDMHPSFSPDGTKLVYSSLGGRSGQWEIWTIDLGSGARKMIGFGLFPSWSPRRDIDLIAFQKARQRGSRWFSLWTMTLVEGEARQVTEIAVSSNAAIVSPSWSPDGSRIAFATIVEPQRAEAGHPVGQQDIWTINSDGTDRHRLTDGSASNLTPFWAADNRVYFVSDRAGPECIWSVRADGPTKTQTTAASPDKTPGPANAALVNTPAAPAAISPAVNNTAPASSPNPADGSVGQTDVRPVGN